jgi:hypothetical protein
MDERRRNVLLQFSQTPIIDNLRNYPEHLVARLGALLRDGAAARPDPRRRGFYDVADGDRVFFIHVSPVSGRVWLLASWAVEAAEAAQPTRRVPAVIAGGSAARLFASCAQPG